MRVTPDSLKLTQRTEIDTGFWKPWKGKAVGKNEKLQDHGEDRDWHCPDWRNAQGSGAKAKDEPEVASSKGGGGL